MYMNHFTYSTSPLYALKIINIFGSKKLIKRVQSVLYLNPKVLSLPGLSYPSLHSHGVTVDGDGVFPIIKWVDFPPFGLPVPKR